MQGQRTINTASKGLLQRLQNFQCIFQHADASGDGSLDEDEFIAAFTGHMGNNEKSLRRMFMAIDANCDGCVNWEEFSAYLLLERTAAAAADDPSRKTLPNFHELHASSGAAAASTGVGHQAAVTSLVHADIGGAPDRWYSTDSDGVVQVWNGKDLTRMRSFQSGLSAITSAAYLPSSGLLALGSYSRSLLLMDPSTGRHAGSLPNMASTAALSMAAWPAPAAAAAGMGAGGFGMSDGSSTSRSVVEVCRDYMAVGDADGSVRLMQLDIDDTADKKTADRFTARKLWHSSNHCDWVTSVLHCPQISSVTASSLDKTVSMTDLERCIAVRTLLGHTKAVHCCAWNSLLKVIASGSSDRKVLLWNPFSCRSLGTLDGHSAPVMCLASNERDMQLISAAADNTVKVWDLRNQRCLQTLQLNPKSSLLAGHQLPLSVMAFSPWSRVMVAGAVRLQGWVVSDAGVSVRVGHREAVSWAGYVGELQEVVSTDHGGTVCCWDVSTGELLHSFGKAHGSCRVSTAALDGECRRLITGAEDGSINVWNFHSGRLLSSVDRGPAERSGSQWGSGSGVEVTGLAMATSTDTNGQAAPCIVATGWDRKVTWYADTGKRQCQLLRSFPGADSDVLAAAAMKGCCTLATACDGGEVWLWNLDSGTVMRKLIPSGLLAKPQAERSVEALAFMHDNLKHILVAVGADRIIRFWDTHSGNYLEHDTSDSSAHSATQHGDSVLAVTVSPDNATVVTADSGGNLTVWDVHSTHSALHSLQSATSARGLQSTRPGSALLSPSRASDVALGGHVFDGNRNHGSRPQSAATGAGGSPRPYGRASAVSAAAAVAAQQAVGVRRAASWRAHTDAVTVLVWVPALPAAAAVVGEDPGSTAAPAAGAANALPAAAAVGVPSSGGAQAPAQMPSSQQHQQQQQEPKSKALEVAEGQQQAQQLLAAIQQQQQQQQPQQQQQQQQQPQQQQQQQQQPDSRLRQLAAAIQGMHAAAAAAADPATSSAAAVGADSSGSNQQQGFVLSAGLDRSMVLWSSTGAKVGVFGSHTWELEDLGTWQNTADCRTERDPTSSEPEQVRATDVMLSQHSLGSSCSSSDFSHISVSPRLNTPAAAAATAAAAAEAAAADAQEVFRLQDNNQVLQQQQQEQLRLNSPQAAEVPKQLPDSSCGVSRRPGSATQTSPKQPGNPAKAVVFADDLPAAAGRVSAAAAAAIAAATAEARLPTAEQYACRGSTGSNDSYQQQQRAAQIAAMDLAYGPQASSWQSAFAPNPAAAAPCSSLEANTGDNTGVQSWSLAAEEDLPTTLWLPEFTRLSRPTSAVTRPPAAVAAARVRPGTAAAALSGGLHSRANGRGAVLGAAGRSSVVLSARIGGGVLLGGVVAGDVTPSGLGGLSRPKSAGVLQGKKPCNNLR